MVSLTFFGGVNEIGGNKILLEDGATRIWLDFGISFGQYGRFFEEFMSPRTKTGLKDFLALNLVPDIAGLYAPDLLAMAGREPTDPQFDAVIISHPHEDHVKYVSFLHPQIPVFMGETCLAICEKLQSISTSTIDNRICSYEERDPQTGKAEGKLIKRPIRTFVSGKRFVIGNVEVLPMAVDHSIPGAFGFILYTSSGPIVYTGDMRLHGRNRHLTEAFVQAAAQEKPVALITEGTRISEVKRETENEEHVKETILAEAYKAQRLVIVDYAFKDAERFRTLVEVAQETGRKLIVSTKAAALYELYSQISEIATPPIDHRDILIHVKQKTTSHVWERELMAMRNAIAAEEIGRDQDQFILGLNQWALNELIDIQPERALYVRSMSEPYNEEMALDERRVDNWIDFFRMVKIRAHCSGHAPGTDILAIARAINAKVVFPIHTEHPENFQGLPGKTVIVEARKKYLI